MSGDVPRPVAAAIGASGSFGVPARVRPALEQVVGEPLGDVRLHTDAPARLAASAISAKAFSVGSDVFFGPGQFGPDTPSGLGLLAHELTHVAQARGGATGEGPLRVGAEGVGLTLGGVSDALERQAERNEARATSLAGSVHRKASGMAGVVPRPGLSGGTVHRAGGGSTQAGTGRRVMFRERTAEGDAEVAIRRLVIRWSGATAPIQRKARPGGEAPPAEFVEHVAASRGTPLEGRLREHMEEALEVDLSRVRIHVGRAAQKAAEQVRAEAFTLGEDVYFNVGRFAPNSARGFALLGHELTHVAQESGGAPTLGGGPRVRAGDAGGGLRIGAPDSALERQAEHNEQAFARLAEQGWGVRPIGVGWLRAGSGPEALAEWALATGDGRAADRLGGARLGPGVALDHDLRDRLEAALGTDLSDVRLHVGLAAERLAADLEAEAFTLGEHVVLGSGVDLESPEGLGVLVHEATHVVQAREGRLDAGADTPARTAALEEEAHGRERAFVARAHEPPGAGRPGFVYREAPAGRADEAEAPAGAEAATAAEGGAPRPTFSLPEASLEARGPALRKHGYDDADDPVKHVMDSWGMHGSAEDFLEECTERVLDLIREELEIENERRETLAWNPFRPMA